jgi:DNA-binding transcriptional LysR family regulator
LHISRKANIVDQLGAIALFIKAVEAGSFSEAGRQTGLAPSSVSRRIGELEGWIGAALFHRTTRKITLTEVGASYYERVRGIVLDLEEARVVAAQLEGHPAGVIKMTAPESMERHITSAICAFQESWPQVSFALNFTDQYVDLVAEASDLAVRVGQLADSTLKARKLAEARRYLCASPKYIEQTAALRHPDELADHNCLTFRTKPGYNVWCFRDGSELIDIRATGSIFTNSGNALMSAAKKATGLILAPEWLAGPALASGELVEVLPDYPPEPYLTPVYTVHPYQRFVPPKVTAFTGFLAKRFRQGYDWAGRAV